ncbi:MAG: DUF4032 domain-containing protein [Chloroflexi bacterium]|nr:DUF4032 domain-containing protein [Chloroflexota bacterium]
MRFRGDVSELLGLPWERSLADWPDDVARFVELPVGESRHVVRFIAAGPDLLALKELPARPGRREYEVMRELEERELPAVQPVGLVERPDEDAAIVITRYLARSLQLRRLFRRLPESAGEYRERFLDAMSSLLVELHREGVYWGDCSLANTLLLRDGQALQAYLVDAETSEIHELLSEGQRRMDVDIAVENLAGDLLDIAATSGRSLEEADDELAAALSLRERYERLWAEIHAAEPILPGERYRVEARIRRLNELGFVVEEVVVEPDGPDGSQARFRVAVGSRRFHAARLRELTGLEAGEGQATILLNDLAAWAGFEAPIGEEPLGGRVDPPLQRAARRWLIDVFEPTVDRLREALGQDVDPVQAYCDYLEVKWLLSEEAGRDVGDDVARRRLAEHAIPTGAAAGMVVAEETQPFDALYARP